MFKPLLISVLIIVTLIHCHDAALVLNSFEDQTSISLWTPTNVLKLTNNSAIGNYSGCWNDTVKWTSLTFSTLPTHNWTTYDAIQFWVYSANATNARITLVVYSENVNVSGIDYYSFYFLANWIGWKQFTISLASMSVARSPIGWYKIDSVVFSSVWSTNAVNGTSLCFDNMVLITQGLTFNNTESNIKYYMPASYAASLSFPLWNTKGTSGQYSLALTGAMPTGTTYTLAPTSVTLGANATVTVTLNFTTTAAAVAGSSASLVLQASDVVTGDLAASLSITLAIVAKSAVTKTRPFLIADNALKASILATSWKQSAVQSFNTSANTALSADVTVPKQWGGWGGNFVCTDGTSLTYDSTNSSYFWCSSQRVYYSGEPYVSSWYTNRHNQLQGYMFNLAVGYYLTGITAYAQRASQLLIDYAKFYPLLLIRDISFKVDGGSGGRILSQTLDESGWLVKASIAFDFVANTMTDADVAFVEYNLLRSMVNTIQRNDAGESNWQSWHNAAIAAVGFEFNDVALYNSTIYGKSGFLFQLQNSMMDDGIWYENSFGYHYYALQAIQWHLALARQQGVDLTNYAVQKVNEAGTKTVKLMYSSPIYLQMPDFTLPDLNDASGSLLGDIAWYEWANTVYNDPLFDYILNVIISHGASRNSFESMIFGSVYSNDNFTIESYQLSQMGVAVLRDPYNSYALMDYGPHGGWHGHYDKGTLILYRDDYIIEDYGSAAYGLPLHTDYLKRTLSHSTIMIDGNCQLEAQGSLELFGTDFPQYAQVLSSTLGGISTAVTARRTLIEIPQSSDQVIVVDFMEAIPYNASNTQHDYFYVLHSSGTFSVVSGGTLGSFPGSVSFGTNEPSWSYLSSPSQIASVPAGTQLRYQWYSSLSYSDSFETVTGWSGLSLTNEFVKDGNFSGVWDNHVQTTAITKKTFPTDWSRMNRLCFWLYNYVNTSEVIRLIFMSDNTSVASIDYYIYKTSITLNWIGWRFYNISRTSDFSVARTPLGWDQIQYVTFSATWSGSAQPGSKVIIDAWNAYDSSGNILPDLSAPGLHTISDKSSTAKQFIVAQAPNNPNTATHPVAITKQTSEAMFSHLHIAGNIDNANLISFSTTHTSSISTVNLTTPLSDYKITMRRSSTGTLPSHSYADLQMQFTDTSTRTLRLLGYSTASLTYQNVQVSPASGKSSVTALLVPSITNTTYCQFTVNSPNDAASVSCTFNGVYNSVTTRSYIRLNGQLLAFNAYQEMNTGSAIVATVTLGADQNHSVIMFLGNGTGTSSSTTGSSTGSASQASTSQASTSSPSSSSSGSTAAATTSSSTVASTSSTSSSEGSEFKVSAANDAKRCTLLLLTIAIAMTVL